MKELSIKEKAKRYDEAIEKARIWKDKSGMPKDKQGILDDIFPELAESKDEKIRKAIHIYLDWLDGRKDYAPKGKYTIKDMIAWLKKQGNNADKKNEQNTAWSEEDEEKFRDVIRLIEQGAPVQSIRDHYTNWFKSLKERYTWKPSEEQMKALSDINLTGGISYAGQGQELINLYNDLKKLKEG